MLINTQIQKEIELIKMNKSIKNKIHMKHYIKRL